MVEEEGLFERWCPLPRRIVVVERSQLQRCFNDWEYRFLRRQGPAVPIAVDPAAEVVALPSWEMIRIPMKIVRLEEYAGPEERCVVGAYYGWERERGMVYLAPGCFQMERRVRGQWVPARHSDPYGLRAGDLEPAFFGLGWGINVMERKVH